MTIVTGYFSTAYRSCSLCLAMGNSPAGVNREGTKASPVSSILTVSERGWFGGDYDVSEAPSALILHLAQRRLDHDMAMDDLVVVVL